MYQPWEAKSDKSIDFVLLLQLLLLYNLSIKMPTKPLPLPNSRMRRPENKLEKKGLYITDITYITYITYTMVYILYFEVYIIYIIYK